MIIGISGKLGSGKDALGKMIQEEVPGFELKSFAYKLKYICAYLTGTTLLEQFSREGKNTYLSEWGMTVGEMQQKIGTEAMRDQIHQDTWVLALFADYDPSDSNWIITDVRFKNEAVAIKSYGGVLVRIEGDPNNIRATSKRDLSHISETDLDEYPHFDYHFNNKPPIENLKKHVSSIVNNFII